MGNVNFALDAQLWTSVECLLDLYLIDDTNKWMAKTNAVKKETVVVLCWPTCKLV